MITASRRSAPKQTLVPLGPWRGVRDTGDAGQQDPAYLQDAINCLFPDPANGGAVFPRPGFARITASELGTGTGFVQCIHAGMVTGVVRVFAVVDGKVYRSSDVTGTTWTDVTPAGVTIPTSGRVWMVDAFNNDLLVGSTVTGARQWRATNLTSTPITGTELQINAANDTWSIQNSPTIYGGKAFWLIHDINATTIESRIMWSEEGDPTLGYLQTGYTNSWDVYQTGGRRISGILGTNEAFYYFRRNSIGAITGTVSQTFATDSTKDSVSDTHGADTYSDIVEANGHVWFFHNGLPHRFRTGTRNAIEPLWRQFHRRVSQFGQGTTTVLSLLAGRQQWAYSGDLNKMIALGIGDATAEGGAFSRNLYVFDAETGAYEGRWLAELASQPASEQSSAVQIQCIAGESRTDKLQRFVYLGGNLPGGSGAGRLWVQSPREVSTAYGDNSAAMHMSITPHLEPDGMVTDARVDEAHVEAFPDSATLSMDYYTPRGSTTGLTATGLTGADSIQSSHDHGIYRYGLLAVGRWFRAVFHWNVPSGATPYGFERALLKVRGHKTVGTTK